MIKEKIDKKLCRHCDFGDKENVLPNGNVLCLSKAYGNKCIFDK